jgi:hypothetical protein
MAGGSGNGGTMDDGGGDGGRDDGGETGVPIDSGGNVFTCNLLVGPSPLGQWFRAGFLTYPGIDATKWEAIVKSESYIPAWSPPGAAIWNTPLDGTQKCAENSTMPDRVIFHATQWAAMPVATWEMHFSGIVENIRMKWPSVKRIELMLSTVGPGDMPCQGGATEQFIQAAGLTALDAMPARFPGLVFEDPGPGKWWIIPNCSDFNGPNPQYTDAGAADVAKMMGAFFATQIF